MLENWKNKKILILGFGKEGRDAFLFLRGIFPKKIIGIGDKEMTKNRIKGNKPIRWHLGQNYLKAVNDYDVIIKSPGVPIHLPEIERAYTGGKITSATEIFFENCPGRIVGITATKGKSTTTALVYKILKDGGVRAHLVGNIGKPALGFLPAARLNDVYVYELSCHQLYRLKKSPHISIFLNIYPEHLDYYRDFGEYFNAKKNITEHQNRGDYFIFNPLAGKKISQIRTRAKKIPIDIKKIKNFVPCSRNIPLRGDFNLAAVAAAIEVGKFFGISRENIKKSIENFKPLPHRLEFVGTFRGIKFYDDALSTIPEAAIAALETLGNDVQTVILGGHERNVDFSELARKILKNQVRNVILFPTTGSRIWQKIRRLAKNKLPNAFFVNDMQEAVRISYRQTAKGKICLLSCASPSFGMFRDYREKGNLFKKYVRVFSK